MFNENNYLQKMSKTFEVFTKELSSLRTGRANASMLDIVKVDVYGQKMPINQLGSITTPEPRTINIQVWDLNNVPLIDSSIKKSELGLNPQIDGQLIRLPVPDLSEERRNEIKKLIKSMGEKSKISIRNIRREANDELKKLLKNKEISEDDYNNSKVISNPLKMYDCSPISDGAVGLMLSCEKTDIRVSGLGHATDTVSLKNRVSLSHFAATKLAAKKAYKSSSLSPKDIDFAEVHDAFTSFEAINTEDLGFFDQGKSYIHILNDETKLKGNLPINPSGGLKSRGHPVGATGLAQIVDCVKQMRNKVSDSRQVEKNNIALCHSIGGMGNNIFVNILEKVAYRNTTIPNYNQIDHAIIQKIPDSAQLINEGEELEGKLASYTTLYVTPEGFDSPLTLGIIDTLKHKRIFARALFEGEFETVFKENETVYFRKTSYIDQIKFFVRRNIKGLLDLFE